MEGKDLARAFLWAAVAYIGWSLIAARIWPTPPAPTGDVAEQTTLDRQPPGTTNTSTDTAPAARPSTVSATGVFAEAGLARTLALGSIEGFTDSPYRMELELTTRGAGVLNLDLSDFSEFVDPPEPRYPLLKAIDVPEGESSPGSFATEQIYLQSIDSTVRLDNVDWDIESESAGEVVFKTTIMREDQPLLAIRKTFVLPEQRSDSSRHDFDIIYELENLTDERISAVITHRGPIGFKQEDLRFNDRILYAGQQRGDGVSATRFTMQADLETEMFNRDNTVEPLLWTAVSNKYFVVFEAPRPAAGDTQAKWVRSVVAEPIANDAADQPISTVRTITDSIAVEPHSTTRRIVAVYAGPKNREAFQNTEEYVTLGYDEQVIASFNMGACAFMVPKAFILFMIWMLGMLESIFRNYGVAIIVLVLMVRTTLHPITKKGQINMLRMQQNMATVAPKIEEIKKRFPNDKQKQSQETMKVYQESGINPATGMLSSCLPMLLQMPIWVSLFTALNFNIDMRHESFFWWIQDLTAPDAMIKFDNPITIPLLSNMTGPIASFNLLPILVSIFMFLQQKLMPKPTPPPGKSGAQADQTAQMQKMMPYMTLMFGLFFYNMPSGLNLYIFASSFFGMIEQKRIRKHIEDLKAAGPDKVAMEVKKKKATSKGPGLFERLQKAAAEAEKIKKSRKPSK